LWHIYEVSSHGVSKIQQYASHGMCGAIKAVLKSTDIKNYHSGILKHFLGFHKQVKLGLRTKKVCESWTEHKLRIAVGRTRLDQI